MNITFLLILNYIYIFSFMSIFKCLGEYKSKFFIESLLILFTCIFCQITGEINRNLELIGSYIIMSVGSFLIFSKEGILRFFKSYLIAFYVFQILDIIVSIITSNFSIKYNLNTWHLYILFSSMQFLLSYISILIIIKIKNLFENKLSLLNEEGLLGINILFFVVSAILLLFYFSNINMKLNKFRLLVATIVGSCIFTSYITFCMIKKLYDLQKEKKNIQKNCMKIKSNSKK